MFTGLVSATGIVARVRRGKRGVSLTIRAPYRDLGIGESVAVDGACLTVAAKAKGTFTVEVIATTRGRTRIEGYRAGTRVNLERAVALGERLGGHLVAGHVDGVGRVVRRAEQGDALLLDIAVPADVRRVCVLHGSITVDGVSLTINDVEERKGRQGRQGRRVKGTKGTNGSGGVVQVALIPHTREHTTLGALGVGDRVHLEADLVGKYVMQLLKPYRAATRRRES